MLLQFCPLFSGSSGNCLYIGTSDTRILIDAGLSGSRIEGELRSIGVEPSSIKAILVTHEHNDHISSVGILSRRYDLPVYATRGTWSGMASKIGRISDKNRIEIDISQDFFIDELNVRPFSTPHDASEPCGFVVGCGRGSVAVATDIGCIRENWLKEVQDADAVILESNYDEAMLDAGPYSYDLKKRIHGKKGRLSNDDAGKAAVELVKRGVRSITLGHLSKENNFPELAYRSVLSALNQAGYQENDGFCPKIYLASRNGHGVVQVIQTD